MEYAAIDLHKKESQIRIVLEDGGIVDRRIATTRDRLTAVFWGRPRLRILLEAATEREWVAQHLETLGHEVIIADVEAEFVDLSTSGLDRVEQWHGRHNL